MIDENAIYDRKPGLDIDSAPEINAFLQAPFNEDELLRLTQFLDPERAASMHGEKPTIRELPDSYLALLTISNGGGLTVGEREIAYFNKESIRSFLVDYQFPVYMPSALPFGLNGGGIFYIFDMREPSVDGEFPILVASGGNLQYSETPVIANSLAELLNDPRNVEDLL